MPKGILNASGRFLYSDICTLQSDNVYLLGINPGGDPKDTKKYEFLKDEIYSWNKRKPVKQCPVSKKCSIKTSKGCPPKFFCNAYLDEEWISKKPGEALFQKNVQTLCWKINLCPRQVCASNFFFVRSKGVNKLRCILREEKTNKCHFWRIHEKVMSIVMPRRIIVIGKGIYKDLVNFLCLEKQPTRTYPFLQKYRGKTMKGEIVEGEYKFPDELKPTPLKLIGLPHFRYLDLSIEEKALEWIREEYFIPAKHLKV
jgi:hypothetical protein